MDTSKINVGDKVYICRCLYGGHSVHYLAAEVVNKTKSGMLDLKLSPMGSTIRFKADGKEHTSSSFNRYAIDEIPFALRTEKLAQTERAKTAADALLKVSVNPSIRFDHNLQEEIDRLQGLLNEAKKLVEAI